MRLIGDHINDVSALMELFELLLGPEDFKRFLDILGAEFDRIAS